MTFSPHVLFVMAVLTAASVAGCSPEPDPANADDPLVALRAETKTERYRQTYWEDAVDKRPQLFQQALSFCKSHDFDSTTYPNCEFVRGPAMLYNTEQDLDDIETESFDGSWDLNQGGSTDQDSSK